MKTRIALLAAIVLGIIAIIGMQLYIRKVEEEAKKGMTLQKIVIAARPLKRGTRITTADVLSKEVPERYIGADSILFVDCGRVAIGKLIRQDVSRGTELRYSHFEIPEEEQRVSSTIDQGMRALTLKVDQISGVAGLLLPNSHVDVYGTFAMGAGGGDRTVITRKIVPNLRVIAVDNITHQGVLSRRRARSMGSSPDYSSITVAVTPEEAALLTFCQSQAKITAVLRNPSDPALDLEEAVTPNNVFDMIDAAAAKRLKRQEGGQDDDDDDNDE